MPKVKSRKEYLKIECYGKENTGKSVLTWSVCKLMKEAEIKNMKIVVFTNESNYAATFKNFPDHADVFEIYQHTTLEEFEYDWGQFCKEYKIRTIVDKESAKPIRNVVEVENKVFAIIIDEAEYIYRAYIARHADKLSGGSEDKHMRQSDYGVPKRDFISMVKKIFTLPTHALLTSKVGFEYEKKEYQAYSGKISAYWEKTGQDTYRLPDSMPYEPTWRLYLFEVKDEAKNFDAVSGKETPIFDELGRPVSSSKFYGQVVKQKSNRAAEVVIENPTVYKVMLKLRAEEKKVII